LNQIVPLRLKHIREGRTIVVSASPSPTAVSVSAAVISVPSQEVVEIGVA
jgi:hypothetical protein